MKKKYVASLKDQKDWINFTKQMGNITSKEADFSRQNIEFRIREQKMRNQENPNFQNSTSLREKSLFS